MGKGNIHCIEVLPNSDSESDTTQPPSKELSIYEEAPPLKSTRKPLPRIEGGTIATLSGVPKYHTFKIKGAIQWQGIIALIDGGATYNFIDAAIVVRRGILTKEFEGFKVRAVDGYYMTCTKVVPCLSVTLGKYTLTGDFYVIDLVDTNVVLGVQ